MDGPAPSWPADVVERRPVADLVPYARNARTHSPEQVAQLADSIREFGWTIPVLVDEAGTLIAGHGRVMAAKELGLVEIPTMVARGWSDAQRRAYVIADNRLAENAGWDAELLRMELVELRGDGFDIGLTGFDPDALADLFADGAAAIGEDGASGGGGGAGSLAARFGVAPFSVLNAREGWWQDRKRAWLSLGIASEVGRGENLLRMSDTMLQPDPAKREAAKAGGRLTFVAGNRTADELDETSKKILATGSGTSIFDPVLCELAYRWFCPPAGLILDPFAGGSVRGIVAAKLGRRYLGVDLRPEQIAANRQQADEICPDGIMPEWLEGDSAAVIPGLSVDADMVFTCPPYGDLEVYSDTPADLSAMDHAAFVVAYRQIIAAAVARLKPDRFAACVVGDFRDGKGLYRNFVSDTIAAFEAGGARLYNEAILVTAVGSLAIRAGKQFAASRKFGKAHQNVLVFVKGDPARATAAIGECDFADPEEAAAAETATAAGEFGEQL